MKQYSIKFRIYLLVGILLAVQTVLVITALYESKKILGSLELVSGTQVPTARNLALADMHHDAIRGTVTGVLYEDCQKNRPGVEKAVESLHDHMKDFKKIFAELQQSNLSAELKKEVAETAEIASHYSESGEGVALSVLKGDSAKASQDMPQFVEYFEQLEDRLAKVTDHAVAEAAASGNEGRDIVQVVLIVSLFGFILSLVVSVFMAVWTKQSFELVVDQAKDVVKVFSKSTADVKKETDIMKDSTVEQSAAIQESVSALAEMASMIGQTNQNVQLSLDTSHGALSRAEEGKQIMDRMSHAMTSIQKSNHQLQDLSNVIENINSKTLIINDIVFKTQLLSFNASIEAARAGQHGRGFAVVAEEVGNLAELSGQASKDIEVLLSESQQKVKETLEMIQLRVAEGNKVSQLAMEAFHRISSQIEEINQQVRAISEATQQQQIGIDQSNAAMRQMNASAQTNSQASAQAAMRVEELKMASDSLDKTMGELVYLVSGSNVSLIEAMAAPEALAKTGAPVIAMPLNHELDKLVEKIAAQGVPQASEVSGLNANDEDFKKIA